MDDSKQFFAIAHCNFDGARSFRGLSVESCVLSFWIFVASEFLRNFFEDPDHFTAFVSLMSEQARLPAAKCSGSKLQSWIKRLASNNMEVLWVIYTTSETPAGSNFSFKLRNNGASLFIRRKITRKTGSNRGACTVINPLTEGTKNVWTHPA